MNLTIRNLNGMRLFVVGHADGFVVFLFVPFSPVQSAVARQIAGRVACASSIQIAGQVTAAIAESSLASQRQSAPRVTAMDRAATVQANAQDKQAAPQAEAADGAIAEF